MFHASDINPDVELREYLQGKVHVGLADGSTADVPVYGDWERSTSDTPDDFIIVSINGDIGGVGMKTDYAKGFLMVTLYSALNDDGSVKKNRVKKILNQIDTLVDGLVTDNYIYKYESDRFITPTTPNITSGYSDTNLNLTWHTTNNFNTK